MGGSYGDRVMFYNGSNLGACCDDNVLTGLGFIDPASASMLLGTATQTLSAAINQIENYLGIGQGRREADLIVPTQNEILQTVLAPISASVQPAELSKASCNEMNSLLDTLNKAEQKWLAFLHDSRWTDGRASAQAEDTLRPYFIGLRKDLTDEINTRCSGIIGSITGGGNTTLLAGLGIAVLLLPRLLKPKRS